MYSYDLLRPNLTFEGTNLKAVSVSDISIIVSSFPESAVRTDGCSVVLSTFV